MLLWQNVDVHWDRFAKSVDEGEKLKQQKVLLNNYKTVSQLLIDKINSIRNLKKFYHKLFIHLEARFAITFKALGTRLTKLTIETIPHYSAWMAGKVAGSIVKKVTKEVLKPMPFAGDLVDAGAAAVETLSDHVGEGVGKARQANHMSRLSEMGTQKELKYFSQQLALYLTMSYQAIILSCSSQKPQKNQEDLINRLHSVLSTNGIVMAAFPRVYQNYGVYLLMRQVALLKILLKVIHKRDVSY